MNAPERVDMREVAPRDSLWRDLTRGKLVWIPHEGLGWCDAPAIDYGAGYWEEFRRRDETEIGASLTAARASLVARHWAGQLVDIGIGGGRFVTDTGCLGYDVNPRAVRWLKDEMRWADPYVQSVEAVTFWDSLEHIPDPSALLANVRQWVFVSIPIFRDAEHVLRSRHFKPGEHFWYFTKAGFLMFMERFGWHCMEVNAAEIQAGREDILSFAFQRVESR
jgi:hypothetical protein